MKFSFLFSVHHPLKSRKASSRWFDRLIEDARFLPSPWVDILEQPTSEASRSQSIADETSIKTYAKSKLSRLVHVSGFMMMERCVIEAVERSPHQQPNTGPDSRLRGPKKRAFIAYLWLQQVRRAQNPLFYWVSSGLGIPWTGPGPQAKQSRT